MKNIKFIEVLVFMVMLMSFILVFLEMIILKRAYGWGLLLLTALTYVIYICFEDGE